MSTRAGMLVLIMSQYLYWWYDVCIRSSADQSCRYRKHSVSCMTSTRLSAAARTSLIFRRRRELWLTLLSQRAVESRVLHSIHSFIHFHSFITLLVLRQVHICLFQREFSTVQSSASSFNFQYPLFSLMSSSSCLRLFPRLPVTYGLPFIFPLIMCFRKQFLRKMWPIQLALRLSIVCKIFLLLLLSM